MGWTQPAALEILLVANLMQVFYLHATPETIVFIKPLAITAAWAASALLVISACGGSGGSSIPPISTTFSGVAASGKAMANAAITITCAAGSGTTTTLANGSYSTNIVGVTLPCVLQATGSDGTVLYSVTSATATSSNTQKANITPLTQLLVASLTGMDPASFYNSVSLNPGKLTAVVTDSAIGTAQTTVVAHLKDQGVDTTSLPNLINGDLVADSPASPYDVVLEKWNTTQTNGGTSKLPANLVLKPAAQNCPTLRSADYIVASPTPNSNLASQFSSFSFDASTLTAKFSEGGASTWTADTQACHYTTSSSEIVVSPAGIILARSLEDGVARLRLAIPKQTLVVSELAGDWNALSFEKDDTGKLYAGHTITATLGSTGVFSNVSYCNGASIASTCSTPTTTLSIRSNSAGGFDLVGSSGTDNWTDRIAAYRAGNGNLLMLQVAGNGSFNVWTKKKAGDLPAVGTVSSKSWSLYTDSSAIGGTLSTNYSATVTAVDAAAGSFTRTVNLADGKADYSETLKINSPRPGYNFRAATSTTAASDGRAVKIRERTSMSLQGMGVSVHSVPVQAGIAAERFQVTVDQP